MKKILILLGIPGSGKGTQSKRIAEKYNYTHISTGDLLRALDKDENARLEDKAELAKMKAGENVSDELIYRLAFARISKSLEEGKGVVLDGAIRNIAQAKRYHEFFEELGKTDEVRAIELRMRDDVSFDRLRSRLADGTGSGRADDTEEVLRERLKSQGNDALQPISEYYENQSVLVVIDGEEPIESVEQALQDVLEQ